MIQRRSARCVATLGAVWVATVLTGCVGADLSRSMTEVNSSLAGFTAGDLALATTEAQRRAMRETSTALLAKPLDQAAAVRVALLHSAEMQAMLANAWADEADAAQAGRIPNPIFTFERTATDTVVDYDRLLSIGLLDLLLLPQRQAMARSRTQGARLMLATRVVERVTQVREAWVRAIAARQQVVFARRVRDAADASAELAERMQAAGNFNRLERARQQAFYADAVAQLASREHAALAAREALVRLLGLDGDEATGLQLADRLPDLPAEPSSGESVSAAAARQRLDVQLARARFDAAIGARRLGRASSFVDVEAGARRGTEVARDDGDREDFDGYELEIRLPLFDWGGMARTKVGARALAAGSEVEASLLAADSRLREAYSAYRTAFDLARHYRDEVVPLRKTISDENLLRYNGMLIGVFELLADARDQAVSVMAAIDAEQQFWIAEAALRATTVGVPTGDGMVLGAGGAGGGDAGGGH